MSTRTWLVTGCSTGFGRALTRALLERGDQVIVTARKLDALAALIEPHAGRALALNLDITRENEVEAVVKSALEKFGGIDVLVNNAGCGTVGTVEETPMDMARAVMETNYFGTLAMIRAVLPHMIRRKRGQVVNIGSVAGQIGFPLLAYYCASKFALAGMSESLAAELKPLGIAVTLAELGPFATDFAKNMTVNMPASHYDPGALARAAGNAGWGAGVDADTGAGALLTALDVSDPPVRVILGQQGVDVIVLHDARRTAERDRWLPISKLTKGPGN
jgi:NAD(P)-dependent dehydrogenase (short-subunit alcohol dehydrogenase family)